MRAFWCMAAAGVAASAASAQFTLEASVALALTWRDSGNDNGVLEPGESALLSVTAILTPEVGSVITPGTLRGIAWSTFDLRSFNLNGATWPSQSIHPLWDLVGPGNISQDGNSILKVQFGQFPFSLGEINPTNPIEAPGMAP